MRIANNNNNISFNSKIKLLTSEQFNVILRENSSSLQKVDYPWTIETLKKGTLLYTDKIMDCIVLCLTNGVGSLLAHLGIRDKKRAQIDNVNEFNINNIEANLLNKFDLASNGIHGFIFGGMQIQEEPTAGNTPQLNLIKILFEKYKIPYSIIAARKDVHFFGRYSLLFNQKDDSLFITNNLFNSYGICGKQDFKEIELVDDNKVTYNIYEKNKDKHGYLYKQKRVTTSIEDYFKSQFRQVKLNKYDRFTQ